MSMKNQDYQEGETGRRDSFGLRTPSNEGARGKSRIAEIGAVLVVLLIVGASIAVFAYVHGKSVGTPANAPNGGGWTNVLSGYTLISLAAADNNPNVLYACATPTPVYNPTQNGVTSSLSGLFTLLKSVDAGSHWQDIGSKASLGGNCQLAINPTNDNELYLVTTSNATKTGQFITVLRHSLDGGQSWTTLQPTISIAGIRSSYAWNVQQLSVVGTHLFGVQWLAGKPTKTTLPQPLGGAHLVTSSDHGQTWSVINNPLLTAQQSILSYAVDPTNASIIYEAAGSTWYLQPLAVEPNDVVPVPTFAPTGNLYKTTDGGASWHLLLKNQAFGTEVRIELASGNPQIVYIGSSGIPFPYIAGAPEEQGLTKTFHLQMSSNGGASWREVPALPGPAFLPSWFVGAHGQVYLYSGVGYVSSQTGTPIEVTAVAGTPVSIPPVPPQSQKSSSSTNSSSVSSPPLPNTAPEISQPITTPPPGGPIVQAQIERYDPTANSWSNLTPPPSSGRLIASTPGNNGGDLLWFLGTSKTTFTLYRMAV